MKLTAALSGLHGFQEPGGIDWGRLLFKKIRSYHVDHLDDKGVELTSSKDVKTIEPFWTLLKRSMTMTTIYLQT